MFSTGSGLHLNNANKPSRQSARSREGGLLVKFFQDLFKYISLRVSAGQPIMRLGSTGKSTGPHLHLSVAPPGVDVYNDVNQRINPLGIVPF